MLRIFSINKIIETLLPSSDIKTGHEIYFVYKYISNTTIYYLKLHDYG